MVTMALTSLCYVATLRYCVWEPYIWGVHASKGPNGSRIDAPIPFNLVAIVIVMSFFLDHGVVLPSNFGCICA
jgi:hypothetical protein